ncbi:MAG: hypothetical protein V3R93_07890 [Candidatus Hydrothermarchaeaceae archaeon]
MVRAIGATKMARKSAKGTIGAGKRGQDTRQQAGVELQGMGVQGRRRARSYILPGVVIVVGAYTFKLFSGSLQPLRVKVAKSGLAFKDWCRSNAGVAKEDFQDVVAEARQKREKDKEGTVVHFNKELELNEKLDSHIEKLEKKLEEKKKSTVSKRNTKRGASAK